MYVNACMVNGVEMMGELVPNNARIIYLIYMVCRIIGRLAFPDVYKRQPQQHMSSKSEKDLLLCLLSLWQMSKCSVLGNEAGKNDHVR